jgi:pyruvate dehydrogenase E2 component (dihydrolipoamide acetyltransferase)
MAGIKQPSDKSHFLLPDLGEGLAEAELIDWKVKAGDTVKESQTLAEMQTDKALVEVPSPWSGTLTEICGKAGDIIKVGAVLVRYVPAGAVAKSVPATPVAPAAAAPPASTDDQGTVVGTMSGTLTVSDRFARRSSEAAVVSRDGKALATPAVRRIARELGVDIQRIPGSGRGGRVTASDIESFTGASNGAATASTPANAGLAPRSSAVTAGSVFIDQNGVTQRVPFRGVRRKIAESLDRSVRTTVHFTVVDEADITLLDQKRKEYSRVTGQKLSMLPFIMAAVCKALKKHPSLNAITDDANSEILIKGPVNLGCAVDTDAGLMVPVIKDAEKKSPVELANEVKRLAGACKDRTIKREESMGGTFTISNVGSYGGMFATPIINYPEVAILAAGRAKERVMVKDGRFYAGLSLPLSLSCDHRVVDGAEGARFLNTVVTLLENPENLV